MRSSIFKKAFFTVLFFMVCISMRGQATLPFTYDAGNPGVSITGLTQSGLASDYTTSPKMKFDTAGDYLVLNFTGVPGTLSFKIKWNQGAAATRFPGDFTLQESSTGITYTTVQLYNTTTGTALPNASTVTESFATLLTTTRYLKWIYSSKTNGNIGIGAINLTSGINPSLSVSASALTGFSYLIGHGPSVEQSFTVGGSALTNNITLTPSAGYEISTGTGVNFTAMNPVTLTQISGAVGNTTIYTRLKQSLAAGSYSENISISTVGTNPVSITCSGTVTPNPTITLTDVTDPALNTVQGIPVTQILNVSGINLTNNLGLVITGADAGLFSLSQYSVVQSGGNAPNTLVTILYAPVASGTNTALLTITSPVAMPVTRTLYGNASIATGVSAPLNTFFITAENGNILFNSVAGETVEIYNSIGQKLVQKLTVDGINTIPVDAHGVLVVKVGNKVAKVIL